MAGTEGHVRPGHPPESVPSELRCESAAASRMPAADSKVIWGGTRNGEWALRVGKGEYRRGDRLRVWLENVADAGGIRRSNGDYFFELYTEAGWEPIDIAYDDTRTSPFRLRQDNEVHQTPGTRHYWETELTESGVPGRICPDLQSGRYRFVYTGVGGPDEDIAVSFDLVT